jgi:SAM-dependent methyltransferase
MQATDTQQVSTFEVNSCEVCGNKTLRSVLDLGSHPLCDDLLPVGSPQHCREYPIDILYCDTCATAHQRVQVEKRILFPADYHYRARFTADVLNGMQALVNSCRERFGELAGKTVLDVGCNDGSLLGFFRAQGAVTVGCEPTGAAKDALANGHDVINAYWDVATARKVADKYGKVDFVTFTNVFAHISDLSGVIEALKIVCGPKTVLVVENHYLGSVLQTGQFDTFYHEHPRTYSARSFERIAQSLGGKLIDIEFPARYGGNIRVFIGWADQPDLASAKRQERDQREGQFGDQFARMNDTVARWRVAKRRSIEALVAKHGKLAAKAFPGRAAILVKLLGIDERHIDATYERPGSMKLGHYVPGTRIPIESEDVLLAKNSSAPLINFAWHISREIRDYMVAKGYRGEIIDIYSPDESTW